MNQPVDYKELYITRYGGKLFEETAAEIDGILDAVEQEELRLELCDDILYSITTGYTHYDPKRKFQSIPAIKLFLSNAKKLGKNRHYFWSLYYFFQKDYNRCIKEIDVQLSLMAEQMKASDNEAVSLFDERTFIDYFVEPFKNAYEGFWGQLSNLLEKYPVSQEIKEYCQVIKAFYTVEAQDEVIDELTAFVQKHPSFTSVYELLGCLYFDSKMWRNALAYFQKALVDGNKALLPIINVYGYMADCCSSIKDYRQEEDYYRKSLEIDRDYPYLLNNLGYCLYKQRRYGEAKALFQECLDKNVDTDYAANNYVRVLIATGRNKDAKAFVKKGQFRIAKALRDKLSKLDDSNARIKKDVVMEPVEQAEAVAFEAVDFGIKRQQFSSEKLLEDELTLRLEAGMPVFGMNLHIYDHKGDFYGRQYPFEMGRLDLLCEDNNGNLYIIELKKDSGYDDAYVQTAQYLDWFEKAPISQGKKVYGIICLNSPTPELVGKVRNDPRVKLFEYQISYTEIK